MRDPEVASSDPSYCTGIPVPGTGTGVRTRARARRGGPRMSMHVRYPMGTTLSRFDVRARNGCAALSLRLRQFYFDSAPPFLDGHQHADGTGLKVWPTAMPLLACVQRLIKQKYCNLERPLRVLELGSGCGLVGIALAATCRADVVMTDPAIEVGLSSEAGGGTTLDWLRENVNLNRDVLDQSQGSVRVEPLRWGDADGENALHGAVGNGFDLVVGSDLLYDPSQYTALQSALHTFAGTADDGAYACASDDDSPPPPVAVLGYPVRHGEEESFFRLCDDGGHLIAGETVEIERSIGPKRPRLIISATYLHKRERRV